MSLYKVGRYFTPGESGQELTVLYRAGRTRLHLVAIESTGVIELRPPLDDARFIRPVSFRGSPYPVERAVRKFLAAAHQHGCTAAAKSELARAREVQS
jgi:hypothetical protein